MTEPRTPASPSSKPFSSKQPKVFDIRRPGRAIASPTSRPVIASPVVKDSLLITKPHASAKAAPLKPVPSDIAPRPLMDSRHKVSLQPAAPSAPASTPTAASASSPPAPAAPVRAVAHSGNFEQAAAAAPPAAVPTTDDVLAGTAAPDVDMSHAVISSSVAPRHMWREVLVVVGLLLFVVAVSDIVLDAGIVKVHGVPHTHLFANRP